MNNIALLFVVLILGVLLRLAGKMPENAHVALNAFVINISLPALIVLQIHSVVIAPRLLASVAMPWLMFALGAAFFWLVASGLKFSRGTTGALMLCGGLANTSFVGLPMIETYFGRSNMGVGILIDQLGTYLVLSTLGTFVAASYSSSRLDARAVLKKIITFPPLIALVVALALIPIEFPAGLIEMLKRLGDSLAPIALVSVGLQLRFDETKGNRLALATGLGFKLLIAPAILTLVYVFMLHRTDEISQVTLFEAAMGPMIGGAIVASQYGLNPQLVALMVGVGISASFVTLPLWSMISAWDLRSPTHLRNYLADVSS